MPIPQQRRDLYFAGPYELRADLALLAADIVACEPQRYGVVSQWLWSWDDVDEDAVNRLDEHHCRLAFDRDLADIRKCDTLVLFTDRRYVGRGSSFEFGYARGLGNKTVWLSGPVLHPFHTVLRQAPPEFRLTEGLGGPDEQPNNDTKRGLI